MHSTLLLNADGTPISVLPLSTLSWQDAMRIRCLDLAEPLHLYDDWFVRTPTTQIQVPAVAMLRHQVTWRPITTRTPVAGFIFLRDNYMCQYCRKTFARRDLTLDHVQPRCLGGRSTWQNLTTACEACNSKRGHDVRIQPMRPPAKPTHGLLVANLRKLTLTIAHPTWNYYLGWAPDRVLVADPRHGRDELGIAA